MTEDILSNMMKSIFNSISKKQGRVDIELKCNSIVTGILNNVDSQLNMLLQNVTFAFANGEKKEYKHLLIRASAVKHINFSKNLVNPQSIQSAWYSLAK